jgi:ankyrin repeat protein
MPNWFFELADDRHKEIGELLLSHGARHTIFIAALRGDGQFVRDALARDRSLANFEDSCHHRVLSAAVRRQDLAMTRLLLEHGADPNLPEQGAPRGLSLWIAVNDQQHEIVRLLLEYGADPNADVDSCGTPMFQARFKRNAELAELLRAHGGREQQSSERDRVGRLIEEGKLEEAEAVLRVNRQWIDDDDVWGDGILAGPARDGRHDIIAMLMRLGARVPPVSKWAPYYYFKHEATAAFLLEHGMGPDHMNWHRFTLLHHMAAEGELAKAKLLIAHGASIDAIDEEYRSTPLGVAARRGQHSLVKLLLDSGPTLSGRRAVGRASRMARRNGHTGNRGTAAGCRRVGLVDLSGVVNVGGRRAFARAPSSRPCIGTTSSMSAPPARSSFGSPGRVQCSFGRSVSSCHFKRRSPSALGPRARPAR